jgi:hypothetical protein
MLCIFDRDLDENDDGDDPLDVDDCYVDLYRDCVIHVG